MLYLAVVGLEGRALKPGLEPSWLPGFCLALSIQNEVGILEFFFQHIYYKQNIKFTVIKSLLYIEHHIKCFALEFCSTTLYAKANETPTMKRKKGNTKSASVTPSHGEWLMAGTRPPTSSTRIISCHICKVAIHTERASLIRQRNI